MQIEIILGFLSFVMGVVNSISGGAGVFAVPTLLALGIPPINALVFNRMSDLGMVTGALRNYHKSNAIDWRLAVRAMIPMAIGALVGARIVVLLPANVLKFVILIGVCVGIVLLLKPVRSQSEHHRPKTGVGLFMLGLVGMWSGALGMAGATFAVLVLVYFFNKTFLQARSTDIVAEIPETVISVIVLYFSSSATAIQLLIMYLASFTGAWVGAHLAVKHGDTFIRRAMVVIAILMVIKVISGWVLYA